MQKLLNVKAVKL